jgi:hypothetical protein
MSIKLALCALTLTALAGAASADVIAETGTFHNAGTQTIDLNGNVLSSARGASTTVFSNLQAGYAADRAFSSTDLTSVFGDQLATTGTGRLQEFSFTIFNSGTSAGNLTSATALIQFYRASDGSSIGGFTVNTGTLNLGLGFFTALNVTGLDALNINLDTTDIIVTQSLSNIVGPANRLGLVSTTPTSVGSSIDQLYIDSSTVGGGVAGFYNITAAGVPVPFKVGYQVVVPAPGAFALMGLGGLVATRRRR